MLLFTMGVCGRGFGWWIRATSRRRCTRLKGGRSVRANRALRRLRRPSQVSALPVRHVRLTEPHGLRVEVAGKLIAYSGDARWSEHLAAVAQGADLFICEASQFDRDDPVHISYRQLMAHRDELASRRIILTHLGAETLAHAAELELEHAADGTVIEI